MEPRNNPLARAVYRRAGRLQPVLRGIYTFGMPHTRPSFFGWGMASWHHLPWAERDEWRTFREAVEDIRSFDRSRQNFDELMWRHWHVAYAVHHAAIHASDGTFTGVECGVAQGLTAHIAMAQMGTYGVPLEFHLYDSWDEMRPADLLESERSQEGKFSWLSVEETRSNLSDHAEYCRYHVGYIPDTLDDSAPSSVNYLHIDLNAAGATESALQFFLPRLAPGALVVFDDYGWGYWADTRKSVDRIVSEAEGTLLPLPTGQAFYFARPSGSSDGASAGSE